MDAFAARHAPRTPGDAPAFRGEAPPAPAGDARTGVAAVLRWRAWWLGHHLPRRQAQALRLLPVLLHASFPRRGLSGEAPGIAGLRYRSRWSTLARELGLPPPNGMQRGRCAVALVAAWPGAEGLEAAVVLATDAKPEEVASAETRLEAARAALTAAGIPLRAGVLTQARLADEVATAQRLLTFGAILAGELGEGPWRAVALGGRQVPDLLHLGRLAAGAPTSLSSLALTLLCRFAPEPPLPTMLSVLAEGAEARALADPDAFAVRWAGTIRHLREPLRDVLRLSASPGGLAPADVQRALELGRALAVSCVGAIRQTRPWLDLPTRLRWLELLGAGMPRVLLPALGGHLRDLEAAGRLRLQPVRGERCYEVRLPDGAVLGRGLGPVQARIRALANCAQARAASGGDRSSGFETLDPTWRIMGVRLARPLDQPAQILVIEAGAVARPGPPFDLINRGPERALEFDGALAVTIAPGRRPSGRVLAAQETVERVVRGTPSGAAVEVLASRPESRPVAARLAQIAALLRESGPHGPVAVEAGGLVYLAAGGRIRRLSLDRFASRPRRFTPDPESPDLALGSGERQGARATATSMLQCKVSLAGDGSAALLYADGAGHLLREVVPLAELDEQIREARAVVRECRPPAALVLRSSADLEQELLRAGAVRRTVSIDVRGELPRIQVVVAGERFGGGTGLTWEDAAEALLAAWPPGGEGRIGVNSVAVTARGIPAAPLLALWAASVARRRLRARLGRALAAYREAATGRKAR